MAFKADHAGCEDRIFKIGKLFLNHPTLLVSQLLGENLLGRGSCHSPEIFFFRGDIQNHSVTSLGVIGDLHHFCQGDLVVLAFDLVNNDLAGEHAVTLLIQVEGDIEVAEVFLIERVFTQS